jgi:hypothetical protein
VTELERELLALRDEIAWPPTPDLVAAVGPRIATEPRRRMRRAGPVPRLAPAVAAVLAVLAVLLALGVLLAASSGVRATLRDWLGIGSVRITRVERLPDLSPARRLGLGRRTTVAAANRHLGSPIATVRALGTPDAIYLGDGVPPRVSLVYVARSGLPAGTAAVGAPLDELQGDELAFVEKMVTVHVPIVRVKVDGARGYFIAGRHAVMLPDALRPRLAGNTLVWVRDAVSYRLETALGVRAALRLARSVA